MWEMLKMDNTLWDSDGIEKCSKYELLWKDKKIIGNFETKPAIKFLKAFCKKIAIKISSKLFCYKILLI